jgi:cytochrome b involved in lipid metabolism
MNIRRPRILISAVVLIVLLLTLVLVWVFRSGSQNPSAIPSSYSMEEVAAMKSATQCWVAINGSVYDLTRFANAGQSIYSLCGTDATDAVKRLGSVDISSLEAFRIGSLKR